MSIWSLLFIPSAFKCEKEGAKKCFFHVDNEVDSASRGERKQKDLGAVLTNEPTEHKGSVSGLKTAQSNRSRTGSVLAGMYVKLHWVPDIVLSYTSKIAQPVQGC